MTADNGDIARVQALLDGLEHVERKAALMHATANRYAEQHGGGDDPQGELWGWIATTCDLVTQLAGWAREAADIGGPDA